MGKMIPAWRKIAAVLLGAVGVLAASGCVSARMGFDARGRYFSGYSGTCGETELAFVFKSSSELGKPRIRELYFEVSIAARDESPEVYRIPFDQLNTDRPRTGNIEFANFEARSDESCTRLWFVNRVTKTVLASVDRTTGAVTGLLDEPPAWALPDGGVLLTRRD